ncbi:MAG: phosphoglycerol geranylgeranyltransferase [Bacteroidia bacterium]|jgi:phosphoglycerol geranylgeranyltransferase
MGTKIANFLNSNKQNGKKLLAILIDPDKASPQHIKNVLRPENVAKIDVIFIGGSVLTSGNIHDAIKTVKGTCDLPCIIFPGSPDQISHEADAILLLSLISGRNPDMLIGKHVEAALRLKQSKLEILPTGYILIDGGAPTTVSYISGTTPIPSNKPGLAAMTALAGEQLGFHVIYMDAGSGAKKAIPAQMISAVREHTSQPIVVGGGIRTVEGIHAAWNAGADVVVIGNKLEEDADFLLNL